MPSHAQLDNKLADTKKTDETPKLRDWGSEQATGAPNTATAGDHKTAWAPRGSDSGKEWLLLEYDPPIPSPKMLAIHETFHPGSVVEVVLYSNKGEGTKIWANPFPTAPSEPKRVLQVPVRDGTATKYVKILLETRAVRGWNEIDAVGIQDGEGKWHWATKSAASSSYASGDMDRQLKTQLPQRAGVDGPLADAALENPYADFPDLAQLQESLPLRGKNCCAPVATSNALAWLAKQGHPRLLPAAGQLAMARVLASPQYMSTRSDGTGPTDLLTGLVNYVKRCGYQFERLEYRGWRSVNAKFHRPSQLPSKQFLKDGLAKNGAILLNLGWYRKNGDDYRRVGGHWVTLVAVKDDVLIISDPWGTVDTPETVGIRTIEAGELTGSKKGLPRSAVGALELGGKYHINNRGRTAILDCAVAFRLK